MGGDSPRLAVRLARELMESGLPDTRTEVELAVWSKCRDAIGESASRCLVEFDGAMRAEGLAGDMSWHGVGLSVYTLPTGMELAATVHEWLVDEVLVLLDDADALPGDVGDG